MFNVMQMQALKKEIAELRQEIKAMKDEQIKKRRNDEDLMFNLDGDNIPVLQGIVKRVNLVVNGDGTANAELIIEAINGQSKAQIRADRIDLTGAEINLTANNIKITGTNFTVDKNGNLTCKGAKLNTATINDATMNRATMNQANIKSNCVIGSDLSEGVAMQFGKNYTDDEGNVSGVHMHMTEMEDGASGGMRRGIRFTAGYDRQGDPIYGTLVLDARNTAFVTENDEGYGLGGLSGAFVGIDRTDENDNPRVGIRVGDKALWIDSSGIYTSHPITTGVSP